MYRCESEDYVSYETMQRFGWILSIHKKFLEGSNNNRSFSDRFFHHGINFYRCAVSGTFRKP